MFSFIKFVSLALIVVGLCSCGIKSDLYLPQDVSAQAESK